MQPALLQFTTAPGKNCRGCLFEHERSTVCHEAVRVALRAGLADCEYSGLIYVLKAADERQLELIPQGEHDGK
jgi:hypothetical protein